MENSKINKAVLAYSGGLDTSIILKWLQDAYGCDVVTFTADIGQGEDLEPARERAKKFGIQEIMVKDLREEFVADFVFPMLRANTLYEGEYMLGTAIARPLIAKYLVETARQTNADAIAHGATGKGNDQVRFELSAYALAPQIKIIAPWREWDLSSREKLLQYAERHGIHVEKKSDGGSPYSTDANMLHISHEGNELEDPWNIPDDQAWAWTVSPMDAPDEPQELVIEFRAGDPASLDGEALNPAQMLQRLNEIGSKHGIGRSDIVENRYVGMKNRGCYETPGGTIIHKAHRAMESLTLDREVAHLKDEMMPRYASLIYYGFWFSPERQMIQTMIDASQQNVNGEVRLRLYKGNVDVLARRSHTDSLFDEKIVTFEEDSGAYNQADATGFIKLNALRLKLASNRLK